MRLFAPNMDNQLPCSNTNLVLPDAAGMVKAVEATARIELEDVFGKPRPYATELIPDFDGESTMMVGDRLDTDMLFGKRAGVGTRVLVMSGFSNNSDGHDDFWAESVVQIKKAFEAQN